MTNEARMKREARQQVVNKLMAAGHPSHIAKQLADRAVAIGYKRAIAQHA